MIPIHFHAAFFPAFGAFRVSMVFPMRQPRPSETVIASNGGCLIPLDGNRPNAFAVMSPADFLIWARSPGPIVIDGITVDFIDQTVHGTSEDQIKAYFRQVADAYEATVGGQN